MRDDDFGLECFHRKRRPHKNQAEQCRTVHQLKRPNNPKTQVNLQHLPGKCLKSQYLTDESGVFSNCLQVTSHSFVFLNSWTLLWLQLETYTTDYEGKRKYLVHSRGSTLCRGVLSAGIQDTAADADTDILEFYLSGEISDSTYLHKTSTCILTQDFSGMKDLHCTDKRQPQSQIPFKYHHSHYTHINTLLMPNCWQTKECLCVVIVSVSLYQLCALLVKILIMMNLPPTDLAWLDPLISSSSLLIN